MVTVTVVKKLVFFPLKDVKVYAVSVNRGILAKLILSLRHKIGVWKITFNTCNLCVCVGGRLGKDCGAVGREIWVETG